MEFRILGPLEVVDEGRSIHLGGLRQRALLAVLLLRRNEVVPTVRLIDELWGEEPPATGAKTIHVYVSRLRKALGEDVLRSHAPGYLLRVEPGQLDLDRFEALLEEARTSDPAGAAAKLREALSLWRGPPLAEFAHEPFAEAEIAWLEERRLAAIEERIEADLALGRQLELVSELEALAARNPLRERPRAQLMLALYRSGRQAEALAAYQDARQVLAEELGLEPGPALQRLEKAILTQDPSLETPARLEERVPARPQPPAKGTRNARTADVFVGRERELGELLSGLEDAFVGRGHLFLVSGEPGIGKSRLADEVANEARERGAQVLIGRCWEAGGAPAYWPWVQPVRAYLAACDRERLRLELGSGASDLAQIIPELIEFFPDLPSPPALDPEAARFRLFDATALFLKRAAKSQPLVLLLDDLHAADAPSLLLLQFVAAELAEAHILILGAFRDIGPTLEDPLSSALAELTRQAATRLLPLEGLKEREVASFIELSEGVEPTQDVVAAVHRQTEGNPLFVGEVVGLLAYEGRLTDFSGEEPSPLRIPATVRAVIGRRLRHFSESCRAVLSTASVLGRDVDLDALAVVSGLAKDQVLDVLDEAVTARALIDVPGVAATDRLRFSHALIRDALYEELSPARRVTLHRHVGDALERLYAHDPEPHLAELAHHFSAAAAGGETEKAIDYARRAGERAARLLAFEEAVRLFHVALRILESMVAPNEETRGELLLALGDAHARAGDEPKAKETFLRAADVARDAGDAEQLARAALGYGGRFVWARAGTDKHVVPLLESALTALGEDDSPLRVKLLARLAGALRDQHDHEPRAALSREALEMARRIGDPSTLAYALQGRCMAIFWPENPEERIAIASELLRLAESIADREQAAAARYYRMMFQLELGDMPAVRAGLDEYALLAEELRQPAQLWLLVATRATLALFEGRFEAGEALVEEALELGRHAQGADAVLSHRIHVFTLRSQQGRLEGLEEILTRSAEEYPARPMFRCMLARLYADLAREADAQRFFDELAADEFAALPLTNEWLFSLGFLTDVAEHLGDAARARTLYSLLSPHAARNACTTDYISTGSVSRPLGILASTLSRWRDAERHFEDALEANARMGARPWVAHTQHEYARMLLGRDEPGDRERASRLLASCLGTFRELGMEIFAERASRLEPAVQAQT